MIVDFFAVQVAVDNRLVASEELDRLVNRIGDSAKAGQAFPYITYAQPDANPFDTKTTQGAQIAFQIDIWTQSDRYETNQILKVVQQIMNKPIQVIEEETAICHSQLFHSGIYDDPDGRTLHGVLQYNIHTMEVKRNG